MSAKWPILDTDAVLPEGMTEGYLRKVINLGSVQDALNTRHGHLKWTKQDLVDHMVLSQKKKAKKGQVEAAKKRQAEGPEFIVDRSFDERFQSYLLAYENLTPNDEQGLRTLVTLEIQMQKAQQDMLVAEGAANMSKAADTIATLSREHRQLQASLGIDRAKRKSESNAQDEVNRLRDAADEFVTNLGTPIRCATCVSKFEMGLVLFHFRDDVPWTFNFMCPKCKAANTIKGMVND